MSLSTESKTTREVKDYDENICTSAKMHASLTLENLRNQVSAYLTTEQELDLKQLQNKDKAMCSTTELESIRRERNRMHAKKTRLRKKKMLSEMETVLLLLLLLLILLIDF
jgi:hypothetical protein